MSCRAKRDPNGTWHIQYRWTDWTGTKKKSQKRGFKTKKEAEEWYAHFILQQTSDPTMTLNDFWEIYKADMEKRLRKTTMKQKEYVMKDNENYQKFYCISSASTQSAEAELPAVFADEEPVDVVSVTEAPDALPAKDEAVLTTEEPSIA